MAGVHEARVENWRDVIGGVDLEGYFTMIHAALPTMLEQESGSIVSVARWPGSPGSTTPTPTPRPRARSST